ncbi:hypothetical protein [Thermohalobacter berrensis]|uniref:Uncharacterized protein n=1 Tax=Thermohalobacter berrensis TaxID=99594 RepID=A0A419T3Z1_9FIRM|nr:hypothetical protein [Thermohalobacter berrensis]RKD32274.1 hypothetical protein BET03_02885 [Thermohalobacter berrensis]
MLLIFIINIVLSILIVTLYFNKFDIIKTVVFALSLFFSKFVVVSGFYFWLDSFNHLSVLIMTIIIQIVILTFLYFKDYKPSISFDIRNSIIPLIIVLLILPITIDKFEFFGMGQDQGVYQTKAIDLMYEKTKNQQDLIERKYLEEEDFTKFIHIIEKELLGFYRYDHRKPTLEKSDRISPVSGIYHGIPTFPALLSLWGILFGINNMIDIQTIFFICSIFTIYYIMENLYIGYKGKVLGTLAFAISPIALWVSKSSLTEMFLCLIVVNYIYFLSSNNENEKWISSLAIATFSFFHVSIYTLMPIFILVYAALVVLTSKRKYLIASIISIISFIVGFTMMAHVSPTYMFNNYHRFPIDKIVSEEFSLEFAYIISFISIIGMYIIYKSKKTISLSKLKESKLFINILRIIVVGSLILITIHGFKIGFGYLEPSRISTQGYYYGSGLFAFNQLTLSAYLYGTGIILIPIVIIGLLIKTKRFLDGKNIFIILLLFLYCILFYSSILRKEIPHYYYYSRYLVPFIPLITISVAKLVDNLSRYIICAICIIIICINLPFNYVLFKELDDTRLEWEVLTRISKNINDDTVVLMDVDLIPKMYLPIKAMNNILVFPRSDSLENDLNKLSRFNKEVVIITNDMFVPNENNLKIVNRLDNTMSQDLIHKHPTIIPFPTYMTKSKEVITVYKVNKELYEYDFNNKDTFKFTGFYSLENYFRWTKEGKSYIELFLKPDNYIFKIHQGPGIPFSKLEKESLSLKLYINDILCDEVVVDKESNGKVLELYVPKSAVRKGRNIMYLESETWSPSNYGSADARELGISIDKILIKPLASKLEYDFGSGEEDFVFSGFSVPEKSFRWTSGQKSNLLVRLEPNRNYILNIQLGPGIPLKKLNKKSISGSVQINGHDKMYFTINVGSKKEKLSFQVPKEWLSDNWYNNILIEVENWSPSQYGSGDTRQLGIAVDKIVFESINK